MAALTFPGFPAATLTFLAELKANNDRAWFAAHKPDYERAIRAPAEAFVAAVTPGLEEIAGGPIRAKIFKIHRDVRFSADKRPYNTHLHIGFSAEGRSDRGAPSPGGFFFGLEPDRLHLGGGTFELPGGRLDAYRSAAADAAQGAALAQLAQQLAVDGFTLNPPDLKRVPAPYPANHPNGDFLRRKRLSAWRETTDRDLIESPHLVDHVRDAFAAVAPLNAWLRGAVEMV